MRSRSTGIIRGAWVTPEPGYSLPAGNGRRARKPANRKNSSEKQLRERDSLTIPEKVAMVNL
jgi:hypothetical protein